jgi:hypothetical protein
MNANGFLPLIEAFLAFALTMLALTTAVAAVAGVWQRLFRWRSRGLRDSVEYLYQHTLQPRLEHRGMRRSPAQWEDARRQFIVDMTMVPIPRIDKNHEDTTDWRLQLLRDAEASEFFSCWKKWRSLRYGLDWLSDTEFRNRLADSAARAEIKARADPWDAENLLLQRFTALGHATTESFARRSRVLTIVVGFVFVFGVNVDSIHLFNNYLTDPSLRSQIIDTQEELLKASQNAVGNSSMANDNGNEIDDAITELSSITNNIQTAIDSAIDSDAARELEGALAIAEAATSQLEATKKELAEISKDSAEITAAINSVHLIAASVTQTFPVGWNQYPNCSPLSPDSRCAVLITADQIKPAANAVSRDSGKFGGNNAPASVFALITAPWRAAVSARIHLKPVYEADAAMFWRWFVGVLLTGILVGLGTPFWVKTVNGALAARNWIQKGDRAETAPAESAPQGGATAASSPRRSASPPGKDIDEMMKIARAAADNVQAPGPKVPDQETTT